MQSSLPLKKLVQSTTTSPVFLLYLCNVRNGHCTMLIRFSSNSSLRMQTKKSFGNGRAFRGAFFTHEANRKRRTHPKIIFLKASKQLTSKRGGFFSVKKRDAELSTHFANRNSPFEKSAFLKKRGLERKGFKRIRFISKESRAFEKRLSKKGLCYYFAS